MSSPLNNLQEYFREVEAEMAALKAEIKAKDEAASGLITSCGISAIGEVPAMHFLGAGEPFTLTLKQLRAMRAHLSDVDQFLAQNGAGQNPSSVGPEAKADNTWATAYPSASEICPAPPVNSFPRFGNESPAVGTASDPDETSRLESPPPDANDGEGPLYKTLPLRERPDYGISRIDQPEKSNHGWYVRITKRGHTEQRFFSDKTYGGRETALQNARSFRDELKAIMLGETSKTPPPEDTPTEKSGPIAGIFKDSLGTPRFTPPLSSRLPAPPLRSSLCNYTKGFPAPAPPQDLPNPQDEDNFKI